MICMDIARLQSVVNQKSRRRRHSCHRLTEGERLCFRGFLKMGGGRGEGTRGGRLNGEFCMRQRRQFIIV
jgi:hypothetical protein